MKKLTIYFDYTYLGSLGLSREVEITEHTTLDDVRKEIAMGEEDMARAHRGENEESKKITANDIELTQAYSDNIPGHYLSPKEAILYAKVHFKAIKAREKMIKKESLKIEKGIPVRPLPPRPRKKLYPFEQMEIGDSFFIPCNNRDEAIQKSYSIKSSLKQRQETLDSPIEVQTFYDETGVRCWRIK